MFTKYSAPRIFSVVQTPNISDPTGRYPLIEFNNNDRVEGVMPRNQPWSGWRAKFIVWLIRRLLPVPDLGQKNAL
jgi:hypothetical protein